MHAVECAAVPRMMSVVRPMQSSGCFGDVEICNGGASNALACTAQIKPDMLLQLRPALPQVLLRAGATGRFVDLCVQDAFMPGCDGVMQHTETACPFSLCMLGQCGLTWTTASGCKAREG